MPGKMPIRDRPISDSLFTMEIVGQNPENIATRSKLKS
jgi:hypothetical protein